MKELIFSILKSFTNLSIIPDSSGLRMKSLAGLEKRLFLQNLMT